MQGRIDLLTYIRRTLSYLQTDVSNANGWRLYNGTVDAEEFYRELLNLIYGYSFETFNDRKKHKDLGIDLLDQRRMIGVEVTANNSTSKIKRAIERFYSNVENGDYELWIMLIGAPAKSYRVDFTDNGRHSFDPETQIKDVPHLIKATLELDLRELESIVTFLRVNVPNEGSDELSTLQANTANDNSLTLPDGGGDEREKIETRKFYPTPFLPDLKYFVGREDLLRQIRFTLNADHRVAIHGEAGIGKTLTCYKYASNYQNEYSKIFFVNCAKGAMIESLAQLGQMLEPRVEEVSHHEQAMAFKNWLEANDDWLTIYDDIDDTAAFASFAPVNGKGDCLFTSRNPEVRTLGNEISIEGLDLESSAQLLLNSARADPHARLYFENDSEERAFSEVVNLLGGTPIAIRNAGNVINKLKGSFSDFVKAYKEDGGIRAESLSNSEVREEKIFGQFQTSGVTRLSGYNSDEAAGEDCLDIDRDVNAFATLIASTSVSPPLSIGLFGEWGAGKSFFMRRIRKRVGDLCEEAQNRGLMQRYLPSYKRIAQIEFNAWHYVESNLWASLVNHIFTNLIVSGDTEEKKIVQLRNHLLEIVDRELIAESAAKKRTEDAEKELGDLTETLEGLTAELNDDHKELASLKLRDVISTLELSPEEKDDVKKILDELGFEELRDESESLVSALSEARSVLSKGSSFLTSLVRSKNRGRKFFWLAVCLAAPPLIGIFLIWLKTNDGVVVLTGFASFIATLTPWTAKQVNWASKWLAKAETAKQKIDAKINASRNQLNAKISELKANIETKKGEQALLVQERIAAAERVAVAKTELEESTPSRLLAKFIQNRAGSEDYRKHLGLLALIRDDFQKLSDFIEIENRRLVGEQTSLLERYRDLVDEDKEKDVRVNRIILYIDDLDRCPPDKVVDVLQAVHLLLAFNLFVVVVGVDARWLTKSLQKHYSGMLESDGVSAPTPGRLTTLPKDYLEKIFQIPFWINPMGEDGQKRMLTSLVRKPFDVASKRDQMSIFEIPIEGIEVLDSTEGDLLETDVALRNDETTAPLKAQQGDIGKDYSGEEELDSVEAGTLDQPGEDLMNQESLEILGVEEEFMSKLTVLLDRSPRALKRFVNIYRLIKAGLPDQSLADFTIQTPDEVNDFEVVLFLLAIDVGQPWISADVFKVFQGEKSGGQTSLDAPSFFDSSSKKDVRQLKEWLDTHLSTWTAAPSLEKFKKWVRPVARYSFNFFES